MYRKNFLSLLFDLEGLLEAHYEYKNGVPEAVADFKQQPELPTLCILHELVVRGKVLNKEDTVKARIIMKFPESDHARRFALQLQLDHL